MSCPLGSPSLLDSKSLSDALHRLKPSTWSVLFSYDNTSEPFGFSFPDPMEIGLMFLTAIAYLSLLAAVIRYIFYRKFNPSQYLKLLIGVVVTVFLIIVVSNVARYNKSTAVISIFFILTHILFGIGVLLIPSSDYELVSTATLGYRRSTYMFVFLLISWIVYALFLPANNIQNDGVCPSINDRFWTEGTFWLTTLNFIALGLYCSRIWEFLLTDTVEIYGKNLVGKYVKKCGQWIEIPEYPTVIITKQIRKEPFEKILVVIV